MAEIREKLGTEPKPQHRKECERISHVTYGFTMLLTFLNALITQIDINISRILISHVSVF